VVAREHKPSLDGAPDPHVERQLEHPRSGQRRHLGRLVSRSIVDHQHVETWGALAQRLDDADDCRRLVISRHDG
jgi:hypothetical protein